MSPWRSYLLATVIFPWGTGPVMAQPQSALEPAGPQAEAIADLFWIFTWLSAIVWVLVVLVLILGLFRGRAHEPDPLARDPGTERRFAVIVSTLAVLTGAIVIGLTIVSFGAQAQLFGGHGSDVTIKVVGHQWWWEIQYEDPQPSRGFTTANEIHVPVGEPITVKLTSADVIHSFWLPNLMGKVDLVTGRENELQFTVAEPGVYRGQCAEYCGLQHAHMGLLLHAHSREDFDAWRQAQIQPARAPEDENRRKGQEVFLSQPCMSCHTIRGTPAGGRLGPDLTHLASRSTLAAGALPFTRGALAAWITDPHGTKPGVQMPVVPLEPGDLHPLLDYLEGLR